MNGIQAIERIMQVSDYMLKMYLEDLTDSDLMVRPAENANHPAWQLGHLIAAEYDMMEMIHPGASPNLPEGFIEQHATNKASHDDKNSFLSKNEYLELYEKQRAATYKILNALTDDELDRPGPEEMRSWAPTIGCVLLHQADHVLLHTGQIVTLRRKLGKKILT